MDRAQKVAKLRTALTKYRGGRFSTSGSGGASGMLFFIDREGREFYVGGFQDPHAQAIVEAINQTLSILDESEGAPPRPQDGDRHS